jgi:hypothetical protein
MNTKMTPVQKINIQENCGEITFHDQQYLVDFEDMNKLIDLNTVWELKTEYPSYEKEDKKCSLLDFIFGDSIDIVTHFKNGNKYDLRKKNVKRTNKYRDIIENPYIKNNPEIIKYIRSFEYIRFIQGHMNIRGCDANVIKNPIWVVRDKEQEFLLMYCEKDTIVKLCRESYQIILDYEVRNNVKLTWFKGANGYIATNIPGYQNLSMHQIITNCYGNGKGTATISVDHIDRDPLNNTMANLRIATREQQQENMVGMLPDTKRKRNSNARDLPDGITQDMMKKHVVYYFNVYDKVNNKSREYFRIEGHPKMEKNWETTKASDVSILDKLNMANKVIDDLEKNIFPKSFTETRVLPKSVTMCKVKEKTCLAFDKKVENGIRMNLKMVMPENYVLETELGKLQEKLRVKYELPEFIF